MKYKNNNLLNFLILFILASLITLSLIYFLIDFDKLSFSKENIITNSQEICYSFQEAIKNNNCKNLCDENLIESCELRLIGCTDDDCFFDKARFERDEKFCFNIEDDVQRAGCSAAITRDNILESVVINDNLSLCNKFEDEPNIKFCKDNYYYAKSHNSNNLSFCESILNEVVKDACFN